MLAWWVGSHFKCHHIPAKGVYDEHVVFPSCTKRGSVWMVKGGQDPNLMMWITQATTGHAPIGAFRNRFFTEPGHVACLCCASQGRYTYQDIKHVIHHCPCYICSPEGTQRWHEAWDPAVL
ncbi:hypothetical protein BDN72DRAFT_907347 [Pluteus cervinus]|uniref:Uncharacterized protein n=1 Tax=Pluteus cervinus TaxID=181527 RepID=A0ACD2ZXK5_9AGAR|nr:hypothetical protein BDN72DRAFT_907347 [Pluteus cervinus]